MSRPDNSGAHAWGPILFVCLPGTAQQGNLLGAVHIVVSTIVCVCVTCSSEWAEPHRSISLQATDTGYPRRGKKTISYIKCIPLMHKRTG